MTIVPLVYVKGAEPTFNGLKPGGRHDLVAIRGCRNARHEVFLFNN